MAKALVPGLHALVCAPTRTSEVFRPNMAWADEVLAVEWPVWPLDQDRVPQDQYREPQDQCREPSADHIGRCASKCE